MQITLQQAMAISQTPLLTAKGLPVAIRIRLARLSETLQAEFRRFDAANMQLITEYKGTPNPEVEGSFMIPPSEQRAFGAARLALLNEPMETGPGFPLDMKDVATVDLSPVELAALLPILIEGDVEVAKPSPSPVPLKKKGK